MSSSSSVNVSRAAEDQYSLYLDYSSYHNSSHERGFVHSAGFGVFICVMNILFNSLLILVLLCRRQTRSQYIYSQIINLAVSDVMYSGLVDTLTVYYELQEWGLGTHVCKAWMVLDVIIPFVSFLVIIFLNIDRLIFAFRPSLYYKLFRRGISRACVLVLPWILSSVVVSPIWLLSSVLEPSPMFCIYGITAEAVIASSFMSIFLPGICITVLTVILVISVIGGLPDELGQFSSFFGEHLNKKFIQRRHRSLVTAMCLVNLCSLTMQLPFGAISLQQPHCSDEGCEGTVKMMQALSWLRSACPGVRPVLWLIVTEVRTSCCFLCVEKLEAQEEQIDRMEMTSAHTAHEQLLSTSNAHVRNENSVNETA